MLKNLSETECDDNLKEFMEIEADKMKEMCLISEILNMANEERILNELAHGFEDSTKFYENIEITTLFALVN